MDVSYDANKDIIVISTLPAAHVCPSSSRILIMLRFVGRYWQTNTSPSNILGPSLPLSRLSTHDVSQIDEGVVRDHVKLVTLLIGLRPSLHDTHYFYYPHVSKWPSFCLKQIIYILLHGWIISQSTVDLKSICVMHWSGNKLFVIDFISMLCH